MALKLSVGLQKKVGLPDYGSLGASCHVEFEIDRCLIDHDLEGFHQQVQGAFTACQQAVNDQLAQQQPQSAIRPGNGSSNGTPRHNGHTRHSGGNQNQRGEVGSATQSQIRAIFAIARKHQLDVNNVVREWFNVDRPDDLSIREASSLIDQLKTGRVEVRS